MTDGTNPKKKRGTRPARPARPSGVTMTTSRDGTIRLRAYGPNAPDLRDVVPGLLAGTRKPKPTE